MSAPKISSGGWLCFALFWTSMVVPAPRPDAAPAPGVVLEFVGPDPGPARAELDGGAIVLENDVKELSWLEPGNLFFVENRSVARSFADLDARRLTIDALSRHHATIHDPSVYRISMWRRPAPACTVDCDIRQAEHEAADPVVRAVTIVDE